MIYQLPSGKCIEVSLDFILSMTDDDIMDLSYHNAGMVTENPWKIKYKRKDREIIDELELDSDRYVSLDEYTKNEKINDSDYINNDDL